MRKPNRYLSKVEWASCATCELLDELKRRQNHPCWAGKNLDIYGTIDDLEIVMLERSDIRDELEARPMSFDFLELEKIVYQWPAPPIVGVRFEACNY